MIDKKERNILIGVGSVVLIAVGYFIYQWLKKQQQLSITAKSQGDRPYWMNQSIDELTNDEMVAATVYRIKQSPKWYQAIKDKVDPSNPKKKDLDTALITDARWMHKKHNGWEATRNWLIDNGYMS